MYDIMQAESIERVMKSKIKISRYVVLCVLCSSAATGAWAAASVRTLGGAGTYSSAASASSAGASSTGGVAASGNMAGVARGGSMRVTPTSNKGGAGTAVTTPSASGTSAGRVATSPRLSIGKVLGGATSVSGGSSLRPGGGNNGGSSIDPGVVGDLETRVDALEDTVENKMYVIEDIDAALEQVKTDVAADIEAGLATKQDTVSADETTFVMIDENGVISLDVEGLKSAVINLDGGTDLKEFVENRVETAVTDYVAQSAPTQGNHVMAVSNGSPTWFELVSE